MLRRCTIQRVRALCRQLHVSAQEANSKASKIRNIAVVAHIDSGKTTLTESILLSSHYLASAGSVDTGSTTTDFLPAERERGITIQSASIPVKWNQHTFNLIDTPGHADFGMEVESASCVVDGAIVLLDSVEGVEAQTKGVWAQLDRYNVPTRLVFLNKLDRPGASLHSSYLSLLSNRLHPNPTMVTLPVASFDPQDYSFAEPGLQGIVDLVKWEVWRWEGSNYSRIPLPIDGKPLGEDSPFPPSHPLLQHLVPARTQLLESLSMHSEEFMNVLLSLPNEPSAYASVPADVILPHLRALTLRREILPVLCGSALKHMGTDILLDYAGDLLASPMDPLPLETMSRHGQVQLLAWKVSWDKRRGWMTFVRIYSGILTKQTMLLNISSGRRERVSKLLLLYASQPEEVDSLSFGSVGVILGLKHTRTGDTLVSAFGPVVNMAIPSLRELTAPPAVVSASVMPNSHSDLQLVQEALNALTRTDPSVHFEEQEGQLLVHGLGALHLEVVEGRLRDEWDVRCQFGRRRVSYREGYNSAMASGNRTWETQVGGQAVSATLHISVRAFQPGETASGSWGGNIVVDGHGVPLPSPDATHNSHNNTIYLVQGLSSTLSNSYHTGLPLSQLHVTVHSYNLSASSPSSILAGASAHILRDILREAGPGPLLEPYVRVKVEVSEENIGKVAKDLTENQGEILNLGSSSTSTGVADYEVKPYPPEGLYIPPNWLTPCSALSNAPSNVVHLKRSIHAIAPLNRMLDYSSRLRALSGGHGVFEMWNEGFREVSKTRKVEILREIGRL